MSTYGCKGLRDGKKIWQNDELARGMGGEMWAIKTEKNVFVVVTSNWNNIWWGAFAPAPRFKGEQVGTRNVSKLRITALIDEINIPKTDLAKAVQD